MNFNNLSRTSLLRILPAAFIGLLPFNLLEDYFLEQHYRLRGPMAPKVEVQLVLVDDADLSGPSALATKLAPISFKPQFPCVSLLPETGSATLRRLGWKCLDFDLSGRFALEDFADLVPRARKHFAIQGSSTGRPLFFGRRDVFPAAYLNEISQGGVGALQGRILVFTAAVGSPRVPVATPYGKLDRAEVAVNHLAAALQGTFLKRLDRLGQWAFSLSCALLVAIVLYTYPVFFTLVFTLIFASSLWVASLFAFERAGWQLPISASLMASATIYLLGMSDRLDKRERREWILNQEAENLRRLDEMRNNFLSLVSHDLKTPIARIRLTLERVLRGEFGALSGEQPENLKRVLSASGELQRSISTLLLLSRIESRDLRLRREPNDLVAILDEGLRAHEAELRERSIEAVRDFEPLFLIEVDRALILEVVNNLLDNAIKYSPRGSRIFIRCGELENCPELSPPQPGAWFEIQDQGPGIATRDRESVFKKFFQGRQSQQLAEQDAGIKGTGLGLYLSSFFVREHGGSIRVYSRMPQEDLVPADPAREYFGEEGAHGTVFRVSLPVEPPPDSPEDPARRDLPPGAPDIA